MTIPRLDRLGNLFSNSDMRLFNRGLSAVVGDGVNIYRADRWRIGSQNVAHTVARDTDVPANNLSKYSLKATATYTGSNNRLVVEQRIEAQLLRNITNSNGNVGFWYKSQSATQIRIVIATPTVEDNYASEVSIYDQTFTIVANGTWTKFALEKAALSSMVLGATVKIIFQNMSVFSSLSHWITQLKFNMGNALQEWSLMHFNNIFEENYCKRFYEKSYDTDVSPGTFPNSVGAFAFISTFNATVTWGTVLFKVQKRASPTITSFSTNSGASGQVFRVTSSVDNATSFDNTNINGFGFRFTALVGDFYYYAHWTADSEIN
jgi:hypothetical protein